MRQATLVENLAISTGEWLLFRHPPLPFSILAALPSESNALYFSPPPITIVFSTLLLDLFRATGNDWAAVDSTIAPRKCFVSSSSPERAQRGRCLFLGD